MILYICVLSINIPSLLSGFQLLFLGSIRCRYHTSNKSDVYPGDGDGDGDDDGDGDGETSEKQLDEDPQLHEVR